MESPKGVLDREQITAEFSCLVKAWKLTWVHPRSGPLMIRGLVRQLIPEQVALEKPTEDAYARMIDFAVNLLCTTPEGSEEEAITALKMGFELGSPDPLIEQFFAHTLAAFAKKTKKTLS